MFNRKKKRKRHENLSDKKSTQTTATTTYQPKRKKRKLNPKKRKKKKTSTSSTSIGSQGNFHYNIENNSIAFRASENASSSSSTVIQKPPPPVITKTKKRRQNLKKKSRELKEKVISDREKEIHSDLVIPQTKEDFERMLFSDENNSYLWIRFMTYELSLGEIERARKVGFKALKKINFRRVRDRLNIYVTLMNIENYYGDKNSQEEIFQHCVRNCAKKKEVYIHRALMMEKNKQIRKCEDYFRKRILKKFGNSKKSYLSYGLFLVRHKKVKDSFELFKRILTNFSKEKKFTTATKYAVNQYKFGSINEGHKYFQYLIQTYSKRTDIWSTFIQMETNYKRYDEVRKIFERLLSLNVSKFKKKKYFKRFYEFEEKYGDKESLEKVKQMAKNFVDTLN